MKAGDKKENVQLSIMPATQVQHQDKQKAIACGNDGTLPTQAHWKKWEKELMHNHVVGAPAMCICALLSRE